MPSKTFGILADAMVVSPNLGAGAGSHLMIGRYSGYTFRSYLKFSLDWAGVAKITSATLYLRNSNQNHAAYGSSPRCDLYRCNTAWSEGSHSCESGYSGSNSIVYPGPGGTLKNSSGGLSNAENTWVAIAVTEMIESWAPASVLCRDGTPGGAAANHGIMIRAQDESTSSDVLEWSSRSTSYDPYIVLTYEDNQPPGAPTLTAPTNGNKFLSTASPTFSFNAVDPDAGDTLAAYDIQVGTTSGGSDKWNGAGLTGSISGWSVVNRAYGGSALSGGVTYYWRARVKDNGGLYGAWSAVRSFSLNRPPTVADADLPNGKVNGVLPIHNLALLATTLTPQAEVAFTPRDADGDAITEYELEITGTGANEVVAGTFTSGTKITRKSTKNLVSGTGYQLRVRAKDALEYGAWSNYVLFKVWHSQAIYEFNTTDKASFSASLAGATGRTQLLYRTATGPAGAGAGSWRTSLPAPPAPAVTTYINIMLRTSPELGTAPAQPGATKLTFGYTSTATPPLSWVFTGAGSPWSRDESVHKSGGNALKCDLDAATTSGATLTAYQDVDIDPTQSHTLSVWVKASNVVGAGNASIRAYVGGSSSVLLKNSGAVSIATLGDWQRFVAVLTPEDLAGNTSIRVMCHVTRTALPTGVIWWDDLMLAEGSVVPQYAPALVGIPAVLDANGVVIDGSVGGVFQLVGSSGGARDVVELGAHGLLFGGDAEIYSDTAGQIRLPDTSANFSMFGQPTLRNATHALLASGGDPTKTSNLPFRIGPNGELEWGDGSVGRDVSLSRSAANVLSLGNDHFLSTGFMRVGGNAFPSSPVVGDNYFRNDRLMWFVWDGTRWLCSCLHTILGAQTAFLTATTASQHRIPTPHNAWGGNIWVEDIALTGFVNTGGTALSASHKWGAQLRRATAAAAVSSIGSPAEIAAGAAGNWLESPVVAINNNVAVATYIILEFDYVKTGTPGNIAGMTTLTYRNVG